MKMRKKDLLMKHESNGHEKKEKWYYEEKISYISPQNIILTEPVHLNATAVSFGKTLGEVFKNNSLITPVAVRKLADDNYSLVIGLSSLIKAKFFDIKQIAAVITNLSRNEFIKVHNLTYEHKTRNTNKLDSQNNYDVLDIDDIFIPQKFLQKQPNSEKVKKIKEFCAKKNAIDKPITVKKQYVLKDQYIRYLVAKELDIKQVLIKCKNR